MENSKSETQKADSVGVTLDNEGAVWLKKLAGIVKRIFIFSMAVSATVAIGAIKVSITVSRIAGGHMPLEQKVYLGFNLVSAILSVSGYYLFWRWGRQANRAALDSESGKFNEAFRHLYTFAFIALLNLMLTALYELYSLGAFPFAFFRD